MSSEDKQEQSKHDPFFKSGLKDLRVSIPFLESKLPDFLKDDMDLQRLEVVSENLVEERLGHKAVDILFKVPYKDKEAFVYILVEHQSTPDAMMPFRLMLYLFLICDEWRRKQKKEMHEEHEEQTSKSGKKQERFKLPVIFPMVYYNGEKPYTGPLVLADLFEDPELFKRLFNGPMHLVEARDMDDQALEDKTWAFVFEMLMKYIYDEDILPKLLELLPKMLHIEKENGGIEFVVLVFKYLLTSARNCNAKDIKQLANKLNASRGEVMTAAEELRQEGREEERLKAAKRIAQAEREKARAEREKAESLRNCVLAMLKTGLDTSKIAEALGLPVAKVQTLAGDF